MICKKCGFVQPDNAKFCNNCGVKIEKEEKDDKAENGSENSEKHFAALKNTTDSRLFLIYLISSSVFLLLTTVFLTYSYFTACAAGLSSMFFLDIKAVGADAKTISVLILLILVPMAFMLLGKWLFYISGKKGKLSAGGINLCKCVSIVCGAFLSVALFGMFFVGLTEVIDLRDAGGYSQQEMTIKILVTAASLLMLVFCVAYYAFLLRMLFGLSRTIKEGTRPYISITYIVLSLLIALICVAFCAYNYSTHYAYADGAVNLISTLPLLFSVPLRVIFAILLLKYKKQSA